MVYVELGSRVLVGLVFAVAAWAKAANLDEFSESVRRLVPPAAGHSRPAALAVIAAEACVAVGAAIPDAIGGIAALGLAVGLDAGFCLVLIGAIRRPDRAAACHCFGRRSAEPPNLAQLGRNAIIAAVCIAGLAAALAPTTAIHGSAALVAAFCGGIGAVLVIAFDDLVHLFRAPAIS